MDFLDYDLTQFNETDVREALIAPLLAHLGYRRGGQHNIRTEQSLSYPRASLGRKKPNDPPLRGRADYTLEVGGRLRWTIEAKAPGEPLDHDAVHQAHSYAVHPEVCAIYFCVTNGQEWRVYQSNGGTHSAPLLEFQYSEFRDTMQAIENLLSPEGMLRNNPAHVIDFKPPLGPGLGSIARVLNGRVIFGRNSLGARQLVDLIFGVSGGAVERDEDGKLVATLSIVAPNARVQALNVRLGLDTMTLLSDSTSLSTEADFPTTFRSKRSAVLAKGEMLTDLASGLDFPLPINSSVVSTTEAVGYLEQRVFRGTYSAHMHFNWSSPGIPVHKVMMVGSFNLNVA